MALGMVYVYGIFGMYPKKGGRSGSLIIFFFFDSEYFICHQSLNPTSGINAWPSGVLNPFYVRVQIA